MSNPPLRPEDTGSHPIYAVAGGNHVTVELDREETGGELDVVEVLAQSGGGGPPPHKHAPAYPVRSVKSVRQRGR